MTLDGKLRTFAGLSTAERLMIFEAVLMLAVARLLILTLPFRVLAHWLARAPDKDACSDALPVRVRRAVTIAARNVPWNAVCLPQAMAAKAMLARRGRGSAVHLGARLDPEGRVIAHAWLVTGDTIVVGAAGSRNVAPLARFG